MNAIPLIQTVDKDSINTSLIALKKASEELKALNDEVTKKLALVNSAIADLNLDTVGGSGKLIQSISQSEGQVSASAIDIATSVESGNTQPVTSGAVDSAILGNTPYNPFFNNYDTNFNIDTVGAGHRTYVTTAVGGRTSGTCPSNYGVVETIVGDNGYWKFQVAKGTNSNTTYTRQNINNGGWTSWKKVLTADDITDTVASNNMNSVTSNAVAEGIQSFIKLTNANGSPIVASRAEFKNRGPDLLSLNMYDSTVTGLSIDFDYANGQIRVYSVINGVTQGQKNVNLS